MTGSDYYGLSISGRLTEAEILEAIGIGKARHAEAVREHPTAATRVLDALGREWAMQTNTGWGAIGSTATADCLAEIESKYGPCEVIA